MPPVWRSTWQLRPCLFHLAKQPLQICVRVTCGCWRSQHCPPSVRWAPRSRGSLASPVAPCASSHGPPPPRHPRSWPSWGTQRDEKNEPTEKKIIKWKFPTQKIDHFCWGWMDGWMDAGWRNYPLKMINEGTCTYGNCMCCVLLKL